MARASEYEVINVAVLGIKQKDVERLERYFALDSQNRFEVVGSEKLSKAHLVIMDADHSMVDRKMAVLDKQYRFSGIMALSEHKKEVEGANSIARPLNHRHINEAIGRFLSDKPDSVNRDVCRVLVADSNLFGHLDIKKRASDLYEDVDIVNVYNIEDMKSMLEMHHFDMVFVNENTSEIDMDYLDVCKWVKQNHDSSVILTQRKAGPIVRMKARLVQADDVLSWPIKTYQFQSCFEREMLKFQAQKESHFVVQSVSNQ